MEILKRILAVVVIIISVVFIVACLAGDGIGPEVAEQAVRVLGAIADRFDHVFHVQEALVGGVAIDETGTIFSKEPCASPCATEAAIRMPMNEPGPPPIERRGVGRTGRDDAVDHGLLCFLRALPVRRILNR